MTETLDPMATPVDQRELAEQLLAQATDTAERGSELSARQLCCGGAALIRH